MGYYNQSCRSCGLYFCYLYFICIHVYFMDFFILQLGYWLQRQTRIWWNTFTDKGKRHRYSTLTQLLYSVWQQTSCPTTNSKPWHGHRVKRSRQDDDTQYQYRKRKAEQERLQSPEKTQQPDARVEKALCVTSVMKKIMKLTKEDLKSERQKDITGRTIETWTNRYKDHHKYKYEIVIASSGSVWTIIIQINFIKQYKM